MPAGSAELGLSSSRWAQNLSNVRAENEDVTVQLSARTARCEESTYVPFGNVSGFRSLFV